VAAQIATAPPDFALSVGSLAAAALEKAGARVPVVSCLAGPPVSPVGGFPALWINGPIAPGPRFEWLRRILPRARRIGVLFDPALNQDQVDAGAAAASALGLRLVPVPVRSARELPEALARLVDTADVLWAIPDDLVYTPQTASQVLLSCFRNQVPVIGLSEGWVRAGALFALERDYEDLGRQAAELGATILRGASPPTGLVPGRRTVCLVSEVAAQHFRVPVPDACVRLGPGRSGR
jgi:putative ABC transport system substrate-binding protein